MCNAVKWAICLSVFIFSGGVALAEETAEPADAWTDLLMNRHDGWTGADGIFTATMDGVITEGVEKRPAQRTVFVFSDTLVGKVNRHTRERSDTRMVNHSFAALEGSTPDAGKMTFFYPGDGVSRGLPLKPEKDGQWYWLSECFVLPDAGGNAFLYAFLLRMEKAEDGAFGFQHLGVDLAQIAIKDGEIDFSSAKIFPDDEKNPRLGTYTGEETFMLGAGVLENLTAVGVPEAQADGFVYVYGYRQKRGGQRGLIAARFRPAEVTDFGKWRYFAGEDRWAENLADAVGMTADIAPELSVTLILSGPRAGKYALIYTPGTIGGKIALRVAETPVGPFGEERILYEEPVTREIGHGAFAYNAKAHPVISRTGELIITYNVNSMDDSMRIFRLGGIYFPRFVRVKTADF